MAAESAELSRNTATPEATAGMPASSGPARQMSALGPRAGLAKPTGKGPVALGNFVLAGLFVAAIGCLYLLSLRGGPQEASADQRQAEARVDAALVQMNAASSARAGKDETTTVVDTFYYEAKQRQIPIETIAGNAFIYHPPGATQDEQALNPNPEDQPDPQRAQELAEVRQLKLQSVLMGPQGARAMISNNVLAKGQTISGWTIESIKPREVLLSREGQTYLLQMPR